MKIAIVILNWNGKLLLEKFLPSVVQHSESAKIYVVDNASSDDSVPFVNEKYPSIKIIQNSENGGFAKGYNDGLKKIDADIFCLLNSDVEVTQNWLDPFDEIFSKNKKISIVQPKILDFQKRDYFEYAGAAGGFIDKLGYPFCRGRIFQSLEKDSGQYDNDREIFWATGACMFIRSKVFHNLKGFDEDYFAHQEEVDLCWRAQNSGHTIYYTSQSHVFHLGGSTLNNMNPKKTYLNFRNSLFSITKNLPLRLVISIIILRLFLDGIAAIRFILQFKLSHCFAIFRAHLSFYWKFNKMYNKRKSTNYLIKYYDVKSIVWSHFVNQVDKFDALIKD